ncbi:PAS domain-containing protein [Sulfuritalea sp.]|uniref:PAS domain-containing protein n=1 Tax=Sulfuritalea sp. TaxID=2480090 RepID=UPI00286D87E3|nr:PAS domain-containing protein [Sulfuritalea sp.]
MREAHTSFSPSSAPVDDHPELIFHEGDSTLGHTIWLIFVGALIYGGLLVQASPQDYRGRIYGVGGLMVLAIAARLTLRYRSNVAAVRLLAVGGWIFATYATFIGEGVRAPILIAYPVILIFSGWMLGVRYCLGLLVVSCVAVIFMGMGQQVGILGNLRPATPVMMTVVHLFVLAMSATLTIYLLDLFRERYREECRLNDEIKLHLKAVEKREGYQRALLENFPFMVWLKDEQGRYVTVNQAFVKGFGWPSAEAVVGKTDLDIAASTMEETARPEDLTVFTSSSLSPVEELIDIGGERRWCETCKSPVLVDGRVVGMVGYARDITARKAADAAIAESQNLLRAVIDTAPLRVFWKDRRLCYLGCNAAFARDAGMAHPQDVIGRDDYQMRWADQAEAYRAADRVVLESGIARLNVEERQTTADGQETWLRVSRVPLRNAQNETIGVLGIYDDITEARQAAAELEWHRNHSDSG